VFIGHPFIREYVVALAEPAHPVTRGLTGYTVKDWEKWPVFEYKMTDEQYLLDYDPRVNVLATTVFSGTLPRRYPHGALWPVAWVKPWGKGRVFYLALGHNLEACRNPFFREFFAGGSAWALEHDNG
jgi:type 1 glutamine amidotransferase